MSQAGDPVTEKAKLFAIRMIRLYQHLTEKKREFVLSKQVLRSGTSIGANRTEAVYAYSGRDFLHKNEIALGECAETLYWLELLQATGYITGEQSTSISNDCVELLKLFTSIVKTLKTNNDSLPTQVRESVPDEALSVP
ncbi:MAG TPA: four helix bundle protein [Kiritimatiellia bacterium]|nr:four helix bundle protein [Kiritimatiellia bacterium]